MMADRSSYRGGALYVKIEWYLKLRWIASVGLFLVITATRFIFQIAIPYLPLYIGNIALIVLNTIYTIYNRRLGSEKSSKVIKKNIRFINMQVSLDLTLLTYLIHFSGTLENPFVFFYIFHMVTAGILLSNRAAYLQATLAVVQLALIVTAESSGLLKHFHLLGFVGTEGYTSGTEYAIGWFAVFAFTLYIAVYLSTTVINRLREREQALQAANKKMAEQDRIKSQYVFRISHDIKGAIAAIQGCLSVILRGLTGQVSETSWEMITRAERRSRYLARFTGDLIYLSQIRARRETRKAKVNFAHVLEKIADHYKIQAEEKGLRFSFAALEEFHILVNPIDAEKLLENLVENAVKYTPSGGEVTVTISKFESDRTFRIFIVDTGIGIPRSEQGRVFDDFYRAKNGMAIEKLGTGLGLSIIKQIVEIYKGTIMLESEEGKGTSFEITLPVMI